jgi:hypothetical protein
MKRLLTDVVNICKERVKDYFPDKNAKKLKTILDSVASDKDKINEGKGKD